MALLAQQSLHSLKMKMARALLSRGRLTPTAQAVLHSLKSLHQMSMALQLLHRLLSTMMRMAAPLEAQQTLQLATQMDHHRAQLQTTMLKVIQLARRMQMSM